MSNTIEIRKRTPEEIEEKLHEIIAENVILKSTLKEIREYIGRFDFECLHECCEHNLVEVLEVLLEILDRVGENK